MTMKEIAAFAFPSPLGDPYIQIRLITYDAKKGYTFPSPLGDPYIQIKEDKVLYRFYQFPSPLGDPYIQILSSSPRINPIIFAPLAAQTKLAPQEALKPFKKSHFC